MVSLLTKADVAKLVTALDLGSSAVKVWGFESLHPHSHLRADVAAHTNL